MGLYPNNRMAVAQTEESTKKVKLADKMAKTWGESNSVESCTARRVSFHPEVIVAETLHFRNFSEKERRSYWYSKEDLQQLKHALIPTVKLMRLGEVPDDDFHCPRGLENKTRDGACQRKQRKIQGWTAVFEEQELQKHEGIQDADLMATRYLLATKQCAFEAYNLGLLDEVAAFSDSQLMRKVMPMEHECAKKRTVPMSGIFGKRSRPLQLFCA